MTHARTLLRPNGKRTQPKTLFVTDKDGIFSQKIKTFDPAAQGIETPPPNDRLKPSQFFFWRKSAKKWEKVYKLETGYVWRTKDASEADTVGIVTTLPAGLTTQSPRGFAYPIWNTSQSLWEEDTSAELNALKAAKKTELKSSSDTRLKTGKVISIAGKNRRFRAHQKVIDRLHFLVVKMNDKDTIKIENYDPSADTELFTGKSKTLAGDWYTEYAFRKSEVSALLKELELFWLEEKEKLYTAYRAVESAQSKQDVDGVTLS